MDRQSGIQKLLSVIIFVSVACSARSQEINEDHFTLYTTRQGLSHNMITGIAQDSIGYLWVATTSGLNRFDGSRFVQFYSGKDSSSLPADAITGLAQFDRQQMAFFARGLHIVNTTTGGKTNVIIPYSNKQYQHKFNAIIQAISDSTGNIFILARSGFYHFNNVHKLVFRHDHYTVDQPGISLSSFARSILWLDNKHILIVSFNGFYSYDTAERILKKIKTEDYPLLSPLLAYPAVPYRIFQPKPGSFLAFRENTDSILHIDLNSNKKTVSLLPFRLPQSELSFHSTLASANDSVFYVTCTGSGFYKLVVDQRSGKVRFDSHKYFASHYCTDLLTDKGGNLWVATSKGLFRQDITKSYIRRASAPPSVQASFPYIAASQMCTIGNELYVGTRGKAGILVFDKNSLRFIRQIHMGKYADNAKNIYTVLPINHNTILLGTNRPLLELNAETKVLRPVPLENWEDAKDWISGSYKDKKGNIWLGASKIYHYNFATRSCSIAPHVQDFYKKFHTPVFFREDALGNLWIAGNGMGRYNTASKTFEALPDSLPYIRMPDRQVLAMAADQDNNLWISCYNNGLVRYNIDSKAFLHFTRDNGLPDNNISSMIVVGNKLWLACYSGIACLDIKTLSVTRFGKEDGFPDLPVITGTEFYYDSSVHKLYIGFSNEVVSFNPDSLLRKVPQPRFFIENLVIGKEPAIFLPQAPMVTNWRNNELTITVGSINFYTGNSQRFAYRIIREDTSQWHSLGSMNQFSLSNLPPGHYLIQAKIFSSDNRWPDQVEEIDLRIRRQYWKRSWFLLVWGSLLAVAGYLFLKWRIRVAKAKEQEKTRVHKLIAEDYKNQFELEQINNYFSSSLAGKKDVQEVLWDVAHNLISRLNYRDCMIYLWDETRTKMVQQAAFGPKGSPDAISKHVFDVLPGQGVVGYVMQTREPLLIPDTRKDQRYRVDEMVRLSEICVPIIHNDELIGIIDSEHPELNYYKARDLKILTTIATLLGNKIKQIESQQSLEKKQLELATINQQLAEAQLSALQAQMNPHFIFNALNSIKRMILDNQQQEASRYLSKFAHMIRLTLNQSKVAFATLQENLEYLESYLEMEKLRFGDTFNWHITIDKNLDEEEVMIPTLMIQPLVENAIWHGLMHTEGDKKLVIGFSKQRHTITCTIEDNGIGIKRSEQIKLQHNGSHKSVGLENLRNRIKILNEKYKTNCRLEIRDRSDFGKDKSGTLAVLNFDSFHSKF